MRNLTIAILIAISGSAYASGMKAGLWQIEQISQNVDGKDMMDEMSHAQAMIRQSGLPPEQLARMQAMMNPSAGTRICISPEMAARDTPVVDPEGRCKPAKVSRSGNSTSFEFDCKQNGRSMTGKGVSIASSDEITTRIDMTESDSKGSHRIHSESRMKYLGSDCKGIAPPMGR